MEDKARLKYLIKRFNEGNCTAEELEQLNRFLESSDYVSQFDAIWDTEDHESVLSQPQTASRRFEAVIADTQEKGKIRFIWRRNSLRAMVAVACLLLILGVYLLLIQQQTTVIATRPSSNPTAILPGQEKAKIFFDDGQSIDLESLQTDHVVQVGKIGIIKRKNGSISYINTASASSLGTTVYNKIITPRAGEYHLILPDGTQVWLNAMTTLRYPISFDAKERVVELDGEAYFKVSKQQYQGKHIPFIVNTGNQQLVVLGTEFNINSYTKQIQTTLVEGSVSLTNRKSGDTPLVMKPNQMAQMDTGSGDFVLNMVDPFYIIAWKKGQFAFDDKPLNEVMESIGRWYNVDISYRTDISNIRFSGTVSKFEQLDKLLKFLELSGDVHFKITERRVIVMK
ncbi:DUF4974 domain-containing protein [Sphingobacterium sp. N143]|uniref:FecR family protein n=1 Tax=Sphingobacterium sp. N143 TaxID=2746727 RepID=UPI002575CFDE|nr:FecR family protein [Sphingobacterium sp. N143]MDM1296359.1 DUF4974 domain-containing protein [Sphingobacterium sp. N143]